MAGLFVCFLCESKLFSSCDRRILWVCPRFMVTGNLYPVIDYISVVVLSGCSHTLSRLCLLFNSSADALKLWRIIVAVDKDPSLCLLVDQA